MTLQEMQSAVCERIIKSPSTLLGFDTVTCGIKDYFLQRDADGYGQEINWPTEGLQVCHEAEKLLRGTDEEYYNDAKRHYEYNYYSNFVLYHFGLSASWEQRLEALCRVWFPARFE